MLLPPQSLHLLIARSHETLLATDEYHSRVFRSLSIGSQSEMKVMFQRIVVHPFAPVKDVPISKMIEKLSLNHVRNYPQGKAYNLIRDLCARARTEYANRAGTRHGPWFSGNLAGYAILHALVVNSEDVMTRGAYLASTAWPYVHSQLHPYTTPVFCKDLISRISSDVANLDLPPHNKLLRMSSSSEKHDDLLVMVFEPDPTSPNDFDIDQVNLMVFPSLHSQCRTENLAVSQRRPHHHDA